MHRTGPSRGRGRRAPLLLALPALLVLSGVLFLLRPWQAAEPASSAAAQAERGSGDGAWSPSATAPELSEMAAVAEALGCAQTRFDEGFDASGLRSGHCRVDPSVLDVPGSVFLLQRDGRPVDQELLRTTAAAGGASTAWGWVVGGVGILVDEEARLAGHVETVYGPPAVEHRTS